MKIVDDNYRGRTNSRRNCRAGGVPSCRVFFAGTFSELHLQLSTFLTAIKDIMNTFQPVTVGLRTFILALTLSAGLRSEDARAQDNAAWQSQDIGAKGGSAQLEEGTCLLTASGWDFWNRSDSFHYVYTPLTGNGELVARLAGINATNNFIKVGLMVRESLTNTSRMAILLARGDGHLIFVWRNETKGLAQHTLVDTNGVALPQWLKLVRNGDQVRSYLSVDGASWQLAGWVTLKDLQAQVYIGMAACAGTKKQPIVAQFDQVSLAPVVASELNPLVGTGDGLRGDYFDNRHLYGVAVTNRVDPQLVFFFGYLTHEGLAKAGGFNNRAKEILGISRNKEFGVRWTGELQAQFTEPYQLHVLRGAGVRVWLNEQLILDDWRCARARETAVPVNLVAGQKYLLRVEYFQNNGDDKVRLAWSSPSTPQQAIPQSQLYSQPTDSDGNGLPDLWEQHYFGQIGVDPNADPDGDGLSNLLEYQRHSDPTDPLNWGVPNEWGHGDIDWIGGSRGNAHYTNGVFTLKSYGDFKDERDAFHYVYQALTGNGQLVARVLMAGSTNKNAKVGLMVRETLEGQSRQAVVLERADGGVRFNWRNYFAGLVQRTGDKNTTSASWLKIVRYGDWVGGYASADGNSWTLVGWQSFPGLPAQVYVGLAAAGGGTNVPVVAQYDQVNLGAAKVADALFPVLGTGDGLQGSYRSDHLLYLPGQTNRVDKWVNFLWTHAPPFPVLNPDSYGICWSGEVQAQFSETYNFSLTTRREDWVRVWFNDQLVIDGWRKFHPDGDINGSLNLIAGKHYLVRVEMFDNLGKGQAELRWSSPSTPRQLVPQSQLYSQPVDSDRNGMADLWEQLYFGHLGVDPQADPDGDGLSNLQEYQYHTNPTKADTDGDGMPDGWEVSHGLDPQYVDGALDDNHTGYNNLQNYLLGLDPLNPDANGDGLPDGFEAAYLGGTAAGGSRAREAVVVFGAQATNLLGRWQVEGTDIYALDRRGGMDFVLTVTNADKYVLNLTGCQNQRNPLESRFKLALALDGQALGFHYLKAQLHTNDTVEVVLPYLPAGRHTVHVFWDGVASYSSLRIQEVKLLSVDGADANHNGIKDWAEQMMADESGLVLTNAVITSYTSPVCLEGSDPYPTLTTMSSRQTNGLVAQATSDQRWYVDVPLQTGTATVFQARFQNGAWNPSRQLQWQQINLLTNNHSLTIRKGDKLWLTAMPAGGTSGNVQISYGTNVLSGKAAKGQTCNFEDPGTYTVTGTYTANSGASQSGSLTVTVVQQKLPNPQPAAWTWMPRNLNLDSLVPEASLQADSRLTCSLAGTKDNGAIQLSLATGNNEAQTLIARLGTNGPVLDAVNVSGFDVWSGDQTYTKIVTRYPDGSQLVEMLLISSPVQPEVSFELQPIVSGVMFEDGTTLKILTATNFDALGQCPIRFIRPASAQTSVCNSIKAYQDNQPLGYRH